MDNDDFLAQKKLKIIEPFLNKEKKLKEIEEESNISYATLKRWVKAYKENGLDGLNKKERVDKNNYKKLEPLELEKIKGGRLYKKEVYGGEAKVWIKPSIEIISLEEYGIL